MLRNVIDHAGVVVADLLNEVLSLNAQEYFEFSATGVKASAPQ